MTHVEFHHTIEPGLYLLSCYGGPPLPWTRNSKDNKKDNKKGNEKEDEEIEPGYEGNPFFLRMGIPHIGTNGQRLLEISPFGRDTFIVNRETNFFQLVLRKKSPARLSLHKCRNTGSRFDNRVKYADISKRNRDPWCAVKTSAGSPTQFITIAAKPGQKTELDYFARTHKFRLKDISSAGQQLWISSIHSAQGRDSIDVTAFLTKENEKKPTKYHTITLAHNQPIIRKFNLLKDSSLFVHIPKGGTFRIYQSQKTGAKARYKFSPFITGSLAGFNGGRYQDPGTDFELAAGFYELKIDPRQRGILHFAVYKTSNWLNRTVKNVFAGKKSLLKNSPRKKDKASSGQKWNYHASTPTVTTTTSGSTNAAKWKRAFSSAPFH